MTATKKIAPIHPGEILLEEFLKEMGITPYRLAKDIGVPPTRIAEIIKGTRAITADTSLRLERYFGLSRGFFLGLQKRYELDLTEDLLGDRLNHDVHPFKKAA